MDEKYRVLNFLKMSILDKLLAKADLTDIEYWVLKYSLGTKKTNDYKIDRLSICNRLGFEYTTFGVHKRIALAKIYKVFSDHMEKL